jgi:glyoxylase-like metal-dependent hydrolase (beta-lactamase superfamily II)
VSALIEEVYPAIFRLEIPIPKSPLKATNAYVIKGAERTLLIDSGQNRRESLEAIRQGLAELSVEMERTDIFVTHMHADHSGLLPFLTTPTTTLYTSSPDAERINDMLTAEAPMERLRITAIQNGFSPEEASEAIKRHPGNDIGVKEPLKFEPIVEGEIISAGSFQFRCIATPGHTRGHFCLYEPQHRLLFSGDHILGDISPNITHYWGAGNPLQDFLASLQKIAKLSVALVLPGHRRLFTDCQGRIEELQAHHQQRAEEAFSVLAEGPLSAYQVAARMTWDMVFRTWDEVAPMQKFFATGEALSHLRFLECQGRIFRCLKDDRNTYYR